MSKSSTGKVRVMVSLVILAVCGAVLYMSLNHVGPFMQVEDEGRKVVEESEATRLNEYDFSQIHGISEEIAQAPTREKALEVAQRYHLVDEDGNLTGDLIAIKLKDGRTIHARLIGIRQDTLSDSGKPASLTFMTAEAVSVHDMNDEASISGGWKDSKMRSWLDREYLQKLMPESLTKYIKSVRKVSNNGDGDWGRPATKQETDDKLWLLSPSEVCGTISWYAKEQGPNNSGLDGALSQQGDQYSYFKNNGVKSNSDPSGVLKLGLDGTAVSWWYRSANICALRSMEENNYFYSVMESGYPYGYNTSTEKLGVVFGFCM